MTEQPPQAKKKTPWLLMIVGALVACCVWLVILGIILPDVDPTPTVTASVTAKATLTSTATLEPTGTFTPIPTSTSIPTDTPIPTATLTATLIVVLPTQPLPAAVCLCTGDIYNCTADFNTHAQAQACYNYCVAQGAGDIHQLDSDGDGSACESLP